MRVSKTRLINGFFVKPQAGGLWVFRSPKSDFTGQAKTLPEVREAVQALPHGGADQHDALEMALQDRKAMQIEQAFLRR